ncbi:aminotransferase class V-fold PLP-dependent enzyme [Neotabrizicola sp. sgz301269]|uniref:aminotransferase class V-fold PLP-dependent enzyme n=1 Tax=Neotabrizicola sp. sgz301269 TaxID=3276282 RepID=UPI00377072C5
MTPDTDLLAPFRQLLETPDPIAALRKGVIGEGVRIEGPFGPKPLIYADYTASGRALRQVESFVQDHVLPFYANCHTEASYCGALMTRMRRAARAEIARACGAGPEHAVVFAGAGATAGINRLVALLEAGPDTRVILGPYEHHSNILPWRESGAKVVTLAEDATGGPDRKQLARLLAQTGTRTICAFSAASNITGILADVAVLTRMVKAAGAVMIWDYAGGGPYLPIRMEPAPDTPIDAIVLSPHKFIGGAGASGVMVLRRDSARLTRPSQPGGGTVRFVSPVGHDYSGSLEAREEAGTPNVLGDIRAALAFMVKSRIGTDSMATRGRALVARAHAAWGADDRIELLGPQDLPKLPIFSFRIRDGKGGTFHQQFLTRLLSDLHGIQARGGCACAGPYVHQLVGLDAVESDRIRAAILAGDEMEKPGFVRLNLSSLMEDAKVETVLEAVRGLACAARDHAAFYRGDPARATFAVDPAALPSIATGTATRDPLGA